MIVIEVIPMSKQNIDGICSIEKECFSVPWSYNMISAEAENPNARFFVCVCDGKEVGYCGMYNICSECSITNIAVLPQYRRKGIADMLLTCAENRARQENAEFLTLEVRKSNIAAVSLYSKHGFTVVGERKNYYTSPTENALLMTLFFKEK